MTTKQFQIILILLVIFFSTDIIASGNEINRKAISVLKVESIVEESVKITITGGFAPFTFTVSKIDPLCYNSSDGMAWVSSIIGGSPPFT